MNKPVLCYVCVNCAYFTTNDLSLQNGEEWNKYSHLYSGEPYEDESYKIYKIYFDDETFKLPDMEYSVKDINIGETFWLEGHGLTFYAGDTIWDFISECKEKNINLYIRKKDVKELGL